MSWQYRWVERAYSIYNWWQRYLGHGIRDSGPMVSAAVGEQRPRVALVIHNPVIRSQGGRKLTEVLGWQDPDELARQYQADLREASGGQVDYQIVERVEKNEWVPKLDEAPYDEDTYLRRLNAESPRSVAADYFQLLDDFDLVRKVESRAVDEIWFFAYPHAGYYESRMVGPGAFWCNAPPLPLFMQTWQGRLSRRFVMMGFSYERGVGEMLESFSHRVESIMGWAWGRWRGEENLWERFTRYDQAAPGQANCGTVHFAPNSVRDYDWGNTRHVPSNCDDWLDFPDFQGVTRQVNCAEWGDGDTRAHHLWWLRHLPRTTGQTRGILNNWWVYAVDPNRVR